MSKHDEKRLIDDDELRRRSYFEPHSKRIRDDQARIEAQDRADDERARNFWKSSW